MNEFFQTKISSKKFSPFLRTWRILLFYGPPGVGKTQLSHTIAYQSKRTVFWVSISNLISRFMGESEKMIEILFDLAREYQPSLIIMEEVDSIGRQRSTKESDSERRLKVEFLKQLDRVSSQDEDVAFIGTTNLPWELDVAFLRRFERKVLLPLLNCKERVEFLKYHLVDGPLLSEEEYEQLGGLTRGMSGAELVNYVRGVLIKSANSSHPIGFEEIKQILINFQPNVSLKMMSSYVKFLEKFGEKEQLSLIEKDLFKEEGLDYIM